MAGIANPMTEKCGGSNPSARSIFKIGSIDIYGEWSNCKFDALNGPVGSIPSTPTNLKVKK